MLPGEEDGRFRILIVDDDRDIRELLGELLTDEGFEIEAAWNGAEALKRLRAGFRPHVIILDLMMPVMDGVELIRRLRENSLTAEIPVVAITADATSQAEARAREAGAADFITKPIDLPALLERLRAFQH